VSREINHWISVDILRSSNLSSVGPSVWCLTARPPDLTDLLCLLAKAFMQIVSKSGCINNNNSEDITVLFGATGVSFWG